MLESVSVDIAVKEENEGHDSFGVCCGVTGETGVLSMTSRSASILSRKNTANLSGRYIVGTLDGIIHDRSLVLVSLLKIRNSSRWDEDDSAMAAVENWHLEFLMRETTWLEAAV